jgi:hypothetical protein
VFAIVELEKDESSKIILTNIVINTKYFQLKFLLAEQNRAS